MKGLDKLMAVKIPDSLKRREILYSLVPDKDALIEYGRAYEDAGFLTEAIHFYGTADDQSHLNRIKNIAVAEGDAFKLNAIANFCADMVSEDDWQDLIKSAERCGKNLYADQVRARIAGPADETNDDESSEAEDL
jgi:hypothetical protein